MSCFENPRSYIYDDTIFGPCREGLQKNTIQIASRPTEDAAQEYFFIIYCVIIS